MDWKNLTLADVCRLVEAIDQAGGNPEAVQSIIDRAPVRAMEHGRVTVESLLRLLDQLRGKTHLADDEVAFINRPTVPVGTPATLRELLARGFQDEIDSLLTEANFPLEPDATTAPVEEYLMDDDGMDLPTVCNQIEADGYVPVGLGRAVEWIMRHLDAQLDHPVVVLGAMRAVRPRLHHLVADRWDVPVFTATEANNCRRRLSVIRLKKFSQSVRILVCRKK